MFYLALYIYIFFFCLLQKMVSALESDQINDVSVFAHVNLLLLKKKLIFIFSFTIKVPFKFPSNGSSQTPLQQTGLLTTR